MVEVQEKFWHSSNTFLFTKSNIRRVPPCHQVRPSMMMANQNTLGVKKGTSSVRVWGAMLDDVGHAAAHGTPKWGSGSEPVGTYIFDTCTKWIRSLWLGGEHKNVCHHGGLFGYRMEEWLTKQKWKIEGAKHPSIAGNTLYTKTSTIRSWHLGEFLSTEPTRETPYPRTPTYVPPSKWSFQQGFDF